MILPKLISIDTFVFGKLAKDYYSGNDKKSTKARGVVRFMIDNGLVPFITHHHIQEILQHGNETVKFNRWSLIGKFPTIAWVSGFHDSSVLGSIYDIHQLEVAYLLNNANPPQEKLEDKFKNRLLQYSSGAEFTDQFEYVYSEVNRLGYLDSQRNKEIESISHLQDRKINETKLSELNNSTLKNPSEVTSYLEGYKNNLIAKLRSNGDIRLDNHSLIASDFIEEVRTTAQSLYEDISAPLFDSFIRSAGVRIDQVTPNTTVGELGYLAIYNAKMEQIMKSLGLPLDRAKEISPNDSTTWVIWRSLDKAMKREYRAHGSNMIDKHMSVLALYVDIFTVDKRVKEYFRQLRRKNTVLSNKFSNIVKISDYTDLQNV